MTLADVLETSILDFAADGARAIATLAFRGDEFFFEGHFPGNPVLPAIVQIGVATHFAARLIQSPLRLVEVTRAVFSKPTGPGVELKLALELLEAEDGLKRLKAELNDGQSRISEFSLRMQPQ